MVYMCSTKQTNEEGNHVKLIGITGGVGAGKSAILSYLQENYSCRVELADLIAHKVKEPGQPCYGALVELLGQEVLNADGTINKGRMADIIFSDDEKLAAVNALIHPAVKQYFLAEVEKERKIGKIDYFFLEAALLIEDGYEKIMDELWYIYATEEVRTRRLMESRGYSEEKVRSIMAEQLKDEEFRKSCVFVIDNSYSLEETYQQIDRKLRADK